MAGSFSGHLIDSFLQAQPPRGPFGQSLPVNVANYGAMSFAPSMHGSFTSFNNIPDVSISSMSLADPSFMDLSQESAKKIAALQSKLDKKLGPEYISQRPGPGGGPKLTYAEGWKIINLANEVFGFNGWSSNIVSLTTDFIDQNEQSQRYTVGVTAIVRVTLRDGVFHEDVGYGMLENSKSKGGALDKCKKEAVTDAIKRTLRNFGNLLGNCLYDKQYAQEVVKIKVPPPKFDKDELHRRPEFEERKPDVNALTSAQAGPSTSVAGPSGSTSKPQQAHAMKSFESTNVNSKSHPPHMRAATTIHSSVPSAGKGKPPIGLAERSTPARSNNMPPPKSGLNTPNDTPVPVQRTNPPANHSVIYKQPAPPKPLPPRAAPNPPPMTKVETSPPQDKAEPKSAVDPHEDDADPLLMTESFEEYGMTSDDDAFFAAVDLGEADTGVGGHIDFDEGNSALEHEQPFERHPSHPEAVSSAMESVVTPSMRSRPQHSMQQGQQARSTHAEPQDRVLGAHQNASSRQGSSKTANVPQRTQTMGGFHFPPGYNSRASHQTTSAVGPKRSADAMLNSTTRRPLQGMGLSHQHQHASNTNTNGKREPLAALDLGDGGDLKRIRR